jgi:polyphosphate kinase 2 (PPK2 family)
MIEIIDDPKKNWKFSSADLKERAFWDNYQSAYKDAIANTSTKSAPCSYFLPMKSGTLAI